ncbi:hypothetical protein BC831DRAFT_435705 [Entophlyctis helioformis]|nr:hypothetical protein BC831DRAFT_435705 [Entophlyctis helioformis]
MFLRRKYIISQGVPAASNGQKRFVSSAISRDQAAYGDAARYSKTAARAAHAAYEQKSEPKRQLRQLLIKAASAQDAIHLFGPARHPARPCRIAAIAVASPLASATRKRRDRDDEDNEDELLRNKKRARVDDPDVLPSASTTTYPPERMAGPTPISSPISTLRKLLHKEERGLPEVQPNVKRARILLAISRRK